MGGMGMMGGMGGGMMGGMGGGMMGGMGGGMMGGMGGMGMGGMGMGGMGGGFFAVEDAVARNRHSPKRGLRPQSEAARIRDAAAPDVTSAQPDRVPRKPGTHSSGKSDDQIDDAAVRQDVACSA